MKLLISFFLIVLASPRMQAQTSSKKAFIIKDVNVVVMTSPNNVVYHALVVIKNGRIESINGAVPNDATVIDGKNKWLIPGLIDMHVSPLTC